MRRVLLILYVTGLLSAVTATRSLACAGLTVHEPGVICDPQAGFCADSEGISLGLSETYLKDTAEYAAFMETNKKNGLDQLEARNYRFSDGTYCDHVEKWCGDPATGTPNTPVMNVLFAP